MVLKFEWNKEKSISNLQKHGVSFEEAKEVFEDLFHISKLDHRFDYFEERWITLGSTSKDKILVVANMFFDDNGKEIVRIISAKKQTKKKGIFMSNIEEREKYDDYEILDEYNFSDGIRGRFYEPKKIPVSLRLDNDIVLYFKKLASEQKVPYQTLINALLRKKLQEV